MDTTRPNDNKRVRAEPADFETAISASGFGLFNFILLLAAIPAKSAVIFQTTTMSYVMPVAECDLKLTLLDKGVLNAMTYAGMITSAIFWGYLSDTKGRKNILVFGYIADAVCVLCSAMSQTFEMVAVFKFFGGFIVNGPGAVLLTYVTELHSNKYRARVVLIIGVITSTATLALPALSWAIFPQEWHFVISDNFSIHSWQIFLAICCFPSLMSGLLFTIMPESPKFLMSQGKNAEALLAFQKVYYINTRKPKSTYPIKSLVEEVPSRDGNINESVYTIEAKANTLTQRKHRNGLKALRDGLQQMKPMIRKPLLGHSIHVYTMQFCLLLGLNTIRLWLPQLFASIAEYEALNLGTNSSSNLCTILEYSVNKTATAVINYPEACETNAHVSMDMYINNIIVAVATLVGYCFAGSIVNLLGTKNMLICGLFISGACGLSLYWSSSGLTTLVISSLFIAVCSVSTSTLLSVIVTLFPTTLRTLVVSCAMMFGRLGALSGNMLFPVFIEIGCISPFLMVGLVLFCAGSLACILPSPKKTIFI
ncbi:synaptic vesicle glycoprotein 2B-like [Teleopsis dalmanni]|uniref:synaptic vesicle glycoprotein 2B-like n=1 Tax=Teleopsis dalmanni TaxID=139649 RepID=UPI0018CD5AB1|nr:synaptic vesicle glycoprotein 2B-like [Teleopsis dalmanni]